MSACALVGILIIYYYNIIIYFSSLFVTNILFFSYHIYMYYTYVITTNIHFQSGSSRSIVWMQAAEQLGTCRGGLLEVYGALRTQL